MKMLVTSKTFYSPVIHYFIRIFAFLYVQWGTFLIPAKCGGRLASIHYSLCSTILTQRSKSLASHASPVIIEALKHSRSFNYGNDQSYLTKCHGTSRPLSFAAT